MTQAKLERRVRFWRRKLSALGISHWELQSVEIVGNDDSDAGDANAAVRTHEWYDFCDMKFNREWLSGATREEIDVCIIHEWLHVARRGVNLVFRRALTHTSNAVDDELSDRWRHEEEKHIEALARLLYDLHNQ